MQNEEPERIITFLDDDWEDAMKGLSDDDMIAYGQKIYGHMSQNLDDFPGITMEILDEIKKHSENFEHEVEKCKIAGRDAAIATAEMERSADAYLSALNKIDKSRGK